MSDVSQIYEEQKEAEESFRDKLSTVDEKGKRIWVYPKKPKGKFTNYRSLVSIILLIVLFVCPFIKVGDNPFLLFNILERKFIIFGQVFWPQDFHLFVFITIIFLVFIILFTVVYGRIFCGWICPQTIFMEGVFRKIEYWIEGDYMAQRKLDKQKWNKEKIIKKTSKQILFIIVSSAIMHTFFSYIMGVDALWKMMAAGPSQQPNGFVAMLVMTMLFYGVFSRMREQVCTTICPYGRLQGVLLDKQTFIVAYDHKRGEKRGKLRKNVPPPPENGDCIDCKQCVYVCPTGIDIRNGTQLECINCTACIDACDSIMEKIQKPKGLIRYASEQNISEKKPFVFTAKMKAYSMVLVLLLGVLGILFNLRNDFETTILRTPGMLFQEREDGMVSNLYQMKMVNKTNMAKNVQITLLEPKGRIELVGKPLQLTPQGLSEGAFFVIIDPSDLSQMRQKIKIGVFSGNEKIETVETHFLGPAN